MGSKPSRVLSKQVRNPVQPINNKVQPLELRRIDPTPDSKPTANLQPTPTKSEYDMVLQNMNTGLFKTTTMKNPVKKHIHRDTSGIPMDQLTTIVREKTDGKYEGLFKYYSVPRVTLDANKQIAHWN